MEPNNHQNGLTTSLQVTESPETAKISSIDLSESDLVEIYNHLPKILSDKVVKVSVTEDTLLAQSHIPLEQVNNGNYWLIPSEDETYWLFPQANLTVNPYIYETVEFLFNCQGYQAAETKQFTLKKPAKLSLMSSGDRLQLAEPGVLDFSNNSGSSQLVLVGDNRGSQLVHSPGNHALTTNNDREKNELQQKYLELESALEKSNREREQLKKELEKVYGKRTLLQSKISELQALLPEAKTEPDDSQPTPTQPDLDPTLGILMLRSRWQTVPIDLCLVMVLLRMPITAKSPPPKVRQKKSNPKITIGIIVALLSLTTITLYASSPYINNLCENIGNCASYKQVLDQAQVAYDTAVAIKGSGLPEFDSKRRLIENAIALIDKIPKKAQIQDKAQKLLKTCKQELERDARLLNGEAEIIGLQATQYQNTSIQPVKIAQLASAIDDLQKAQELWKQSITKLKAISTKIEIYPTIDAFLKTYQKQLDQVQEQLAKKREAKRLLDEAANLAIQADSLTKTAQTTPQLNSAKTQWQQTLDNVNQVPADAIITAQIETLKQNYKGQLTSVTNEITAQALLAEAKSIAKQATTLTNNAGTIREMRRAQGRWQLAISKLNQIPPGSLRDPQGENLKREYNGQVYFLENRIKAISGVGASR